MPALAMNKCAARFVTLLCACRVNERYSRVHLAIHNLLDSCLQMSHVPFGASECVPARLGEPVTRARPCLTALTTAPPTEGVEWQGGQLRDAK